MSIPIRKRKLPSDFDTPSTSVNPNTNIELFLGFDSLNDDTLGLILQILGRNDEYMPPFGFVNKRCHGVFLASKMAKEKYLFGRLQERR